MYSLGLTNNIIWVTRESLIFTFTVAALPRTSNSHTHTQYPHKHGRSTVLLWLLNLQLGSWFFTQSHFSPFCVFIANSRFSSVHEAWRFYQKQTKAKQPLRNVAISLLRRKISSSPQANKKAFHSSPSKFMFSSILTCEIYVYEAPGIHICVLHKTKFFLFCAFRLQAAAKAGRRKLQNSNCQLGSVENGDFRKKSKSESSEAEKSLEMQSFSGFENRFDGRKRFETRQTVLRGVYSRISGRTKPGESLLLLLGWL